MPHWARFRTACMKQLTRVCLAAERVLSATSGGAGGDHCVESGLLRPRGRRMARHSQSALVAHCWRLWEIACRLDARVGDIAVGHGCCYRGQVVWQLVAAAPPGETLANGPAPGSQKQLPTQVALSVVNSQPQEPGRHPVGKGGCDDSVTHCATRWHLGGSPGGG